MCSRRKRRAHGHHSRAEAGNTSLTARGRLIPTAASVGSGIPVWEELRTILRRAVSTDDAGAVVRGRRIAGMLRLAYSDELPGRREPYRGAILVNASDCDRFGPRGLPACAPSLEIARRTLEVAQGVWRRPVALVSGWLWTHS